MNSIAALAEAFEGLYNKVDELSIRVENLADEVYYLQHGEYPL